MRKYVITTKLTTLLLLITLTTSAQTVLDKVDKTFDNITSVDVEGSFCNVIISGEKRFDTNLTGEIISSKDYDIKIKYEQDGATLKVWLERPKSIRGSIKGNLTLKVPANTNINVKNSSGSISVENVGQSEINLTASSGSISVRNIDTKITLSASSGSLNIQDVSGDVHATASSGSIFISGVKGDLYSVTSSGSQKIEGVKGNIKVTSASGSQSLSMIKGDVNVRVSSGSIKAVKVTGDITAVTSSGGIKLDSTIGRLTLTSSSGSQKGTGIKLTGASSFKAVSGSISMQLLNSSDELSFELYASSGGLYAKGAKGKNKLIVEKGAVKVYGKTSSGSQSYK
jgi:hypothetical protein